MRKIFTILAAVFFTVSVFAQSPQKMSYQAVIYDAAGSLVKNQSVGMRVSILQSSGTGTEIYKETFSPNPLTNTNGLVTLEIGGGIPQTGTFAAINWANDLYFIKIETDITGGANYNITGISQLLSVPYALHAKTAETITSTTQLIPTATTQAATNLQPFSATLNGIANGKGFSTDVSFEWGFSTAYGNSSSASQSPVTGSTDVAVNTNLTELQSGTTYHYRINVSNAINIANSNDMSFTTLASIPQLTTINISSIFTNTATSGGDITYDGGSPVTARGVCWSTSSNPIVTDSHTTDGSGSGSFTNNITGLTSLTTYYVRAYATNSVGTAYGDELNFTTYISCPATASDVDGNTYNVVSIGSQCWMKENLKTTKYRDNTSIPNTTTDTIGAYYDYENTPSFSITYGKLYNFYATVDSRSLCPTNWHIPSHTEWSTLVNFLGGEDQAGGKLKEIGNSHWNSPNTGATNETGFTALPGGGFGTGFTVTPFGEINTKGFWWSTTKTDIEVAWCIFLENNSSNAYNTLTYIFPMGAGMSIRCLKD